MKHKICSAIQNKQVISFYYNNRQRVVEPHLLGYNKNNELTLSAWQSSVGEKESHVRIARLSDAADILKSANGARCAPEADFLD